MRHLLIALLLISSLTIHSQSMPKKDAKRPKIGLVLSGGGAKGLAHIGVLKVLEEAGIRPDYITGTSMGSIIGGLYASGYSAAELDSIVRKADWAILLSDQVPLSDVVPEEKNDYNRFQLEFDITKKGLALPAGVVRGQRISEYLSELTWHVADVKDFDDLPIPFRCVAADLITGETHVFKSGDLTTAMRASMAIPSVFTPVELGEKYLVDGGVLDNFPVKVALDMGADIIIGVNVGFKDYPTKEDMNSLTKVLLTSASIGSHPALVEAIGLTDYIISPHLAPYTTSSFFDGPKIIERGEIATRQQLTQFQHLADSIDAISPMPVETRKIQAHEIILTDIHIKNREHISKKFFIGNLGFDVGDTVSVEQINKGIRSLIGTRFYEKITYELTPYNDGIAIEFNTLETKSAKAKFSVHYDNELKAGIIANLTLRNILTKNSRLSLTADISEAPRIYSNLLTFLGEKQTTGFYLDAYFEDTPLPIYSDRGKKFGTFDYQQTHIGAGFNFSTGTSVQINAGLRWKAMALSQESGFNEIFDFGAKQFGNGLLQSELVFESNTLNRRYFATKGHHLKIKGVYTLNAYEIYRGEDSIKYMVDPYITIPEKNYAFAQGSYLKMISINKTFNLMVKAEAGFFTKDPLFLNLVFLGGTSYNAALNDIPFVGLNYREKLVENYMLGQSIVNVNISKIFYAHVMVNGIYSAPFGSDNFKPSENPFILEQKEFILGYGAAISMNSIIGPITLGFGSNQMDHRLRTYINIGFPFN